MHETGQSMPRQKAERMFISWVLEKPAVDKLQTEDNARRYIRVSVNARTAPRRADGHVAAAETLALPDTSSRRLSRSRLLNVEAVPRRYRRREQTSPRRRRSEKADSESLELSTERFQISRRSSSP